MYRMYEKEKSAGFEIFDQETNELLFTMNIDVNKIACKTKIYSIENIGFCYVTPIQIITDKILVLSLDKIFRRIKDLVDLYYISKVFTFDKSGIWETLKNNDRELNDFDAFLNRKEELLHAYDKFIYRGDEDKIHFNEIYSNVKTYIESLLSKEKQ